MDALTDTQRAAVLQLREITSGGDDEVAISVLSSVDWDVGRAADMIFGGSGGGVNIKTNSESSSSSTHAPAPAVHSYPPVASTYEELEVDDTEQLLPTRSSSGSHRNSHRHRPVRPVYDIIPRPLLTLLTFPLQILSGVLRFVFSILRIPFPPRVFPFTYLTHGYRPLGRTPSSSSSRRRGANGAAGMRGQEVWIRDLEEETGALCISRARARAQERQQQASLNHASSSATEASSSSSNLVSRSGAGGSGAGGAGLPGDTRILPDFATGTYEETLRRIQRELKIGCIILVSDEHDDVPEFKRSTLTDPAFVNFLHDNNIIVWGGDIGDSDAHSASLKLQATTYPFVAFIALQPPRNAPSSSRSSSSSSSSSSVLTVLSRHQGRSVPLSSGPTSSQVLLNHLETQVLPRVTPFLTRLRSVQESHERDRRIREEQDRAYKESMKRDKERIEAKIREESERKERERREEERQREEERKREEEREWARRKEERKVEWRRWIKNNAVGEEPAGVMGVARYAIRFPNGHRVVRRFEERESLTALYGFVASELLSVEEGLVGTQGKGTAPPEGMKLTTGEQTVEARLALEQDPEEWWGFVVASSYPRQTIQWQPGVSLGEVEGVKGGGQLVVELVGGGNGSGKSSSRSGFEGRNGNGNGNDIGSSTRDEDDDDAYETESDDE